MVKRCLDGDRIFVVDEFLAPDECGTLVARGEREGYDDALITTSAGFVINKDIRNNRRVIVDDRLLAGALWERARALVPVTVARWCATGLNERFRFYRYDPGQRFAPHFDCRFERSVLERSELTFMVYLNDNFGGGETKFYDADRQLHVTVRPERGMALVFEHAQLHEGAPVVSGRKYVLRTDVMYALDVGRPTRG